MEAYYAKVPVTEHPKPMPCPGFYGKVFRVLPYCFGGG
jgi:hypothetical protein